MKKYKNKITTAIVVAIILAASYFWGCNSPDNSKTNQKNPTQKDIVCTSDALATASGAQMPSDVSCDEAQTDKNIATDKEADSSLSDNDSAVYDKICAVQSSQSIEAQTDDKSFENTEKSETITPNSTQNPHSEKEHSVRDKYMTAQIPDENPLPSDEQKNVITNKAFTCTLSVRCDTILNNISNLDTAKIGLVPEDGVIYAEKTVTFYEGESVLNLLLREMKQNKIHMEYVNTPIYNSAYIEGIANLYEFDCGELSGWMYKVNGWFPNYGCSRYVLKEGDRVEWVYTCDLGKDVGAQYFS